MWILIEEAFSPAVRVCSTNCCAGDIACLARSSSCLTLVSALNSVLQVVVLVEASSGYSPQVHRKELVLGRSTAGNKWWKSSSDNMSSRGKDGIDTKRR